MEFMSIQKSEPDTVEVLTNEYAPLGQVIACNKQIQILAGDAGLVLFSYRMKQSDIDRLIEISVEVANMFLRYRRERQ